MKPTFPTTLARVAFAIFVSLAAIWPASADYPGSVLSLGPVGYWRFNETVASPPLNVITNASALGAIANGVCVDGPVKGVAGIIGNCIQFGNPQVASTVGFLGNKIDIPWNAALNPNPPFSVEFWANPTALSAATDDPSGTGYCPLSNFDPNWSGGSRAGWLFYVNPAGRWQWRLGNRGGYAGVISATSGNAVPGVWQHIVATWDGTTANIYANGVLIGTGAASFANWVNNPQSFIRIGGTPLTGANAVSISPSPTSNNGNRGFDGLIEEVAIYNNVLSQPTVASHYAAASSGYDALISSAHPVGYWPMHDAAVTPPTGPFPVVNNLGSLGSAANGTNYWGSLAAQPGPGYAGFGANSKSVFLDGDNGYCQINDTPGLHWATNFITIANPTPPANLITLAAWVKPTQQDFYRDIIAHGYDIFQGAGPIFGTPETFLRISRGVGADGTGDGNYYEMGASDGTNYYDSVVVPIPPGDIGNWVFLVGTYDGTNWNIYRDGYLAASNPAGTGVNLTAGGSGVSESALGGSGPPDNGAIDVTNWWTIGSRAVDLVFVGQEYSFGGGITEAAVFTNALAPSDVTNLYLAAEVPPIITQAPLNPAAALGYVPRGSSPSFSVWADGTPNLGYMWLSNGIPTGVTTTNYSISNIGLGNYTISVVVTNAYGTNTPSVTFAASNEPPFIVTQALPEERFVGFPFTLSATAEGSPPIAFTWRLANTVEGTGSSNNYLTPVTYTATASLANAGNYTVSLSNVTGISATSAPVTVGVFQTTTPYPSYVVYSNAPPIAYYRLDETNGTTAFDRIGGFNGTYFGVGTTLGVPGYVPPVVDPDLAASFSGLNSYVGNIDGSAATGINFTGHTNFTLAAWVNAPSGQADQSTIIAKGIGANGTTETEQFGLDVSSGAYRFYAYNGSKSAGNGLQAAAAVSGPNGTWQYVVGVYDDLNTTGQGTNMYIYVNGVLEGSNPTLANGLNTTATPVSIGSKRTGNDPGYDGTFNGSIDEVSVFNYALPAAQVASNYFVSPGGTLAPFFTLEPVGETNYAGLDAVFTAAGFGSFPLTYQWQKNGSPIGGATDPTLTLTPLQYSDPGSYSVIIQNSVGRTNSVAVPLVVLSPPTNVPSIDGMVLHLTFDNNLIDQTGRGNNGTGKYVYNPALLVFTNSVASNGFFAVTNTVVPGDTNSAPGAPFAYLSDGKLGQALHYSTEGVTLSGSTAIGTNDYFVTLGVRPDLQFGSGSFTVSMWVRESPVSLDGDLPFFTDALGSTFGTGFVFAPEYYVGVATTNAPTPPSPNYLYRGAWAASLEGSGGGAGYYGDAATIEGDGQWHHLVYVIDRSAGELITYLDGFLAVSHRVSGTVINATGSIDVPNAAVIGQDPSGQYGETGAFDIDDLAVWNRALTALEAHTIFIAAVSNQTSITSPITLTLTTVSTNKVQLSWPSGTLQSAVNVTGPYTSLTNTSPYTNTVTGSKEFFRVKQE